uniref:Apolipophorin-III n=1 Tax=Glossina brevipalpis TaxID=37001 RepID=A0A1A9X031_9MUSC
MNKLFFIIGLSIISLACARVVREAPSHADFSFENFFKLTQERFKEVEETILKAIGASNPDDVKNIVQQQGETLAKQFDVWADHIKKDTEDLKNLSVVKELRETVEKRVEEFKGEHPETAADIEQYIGKAKQDVDAIITKIKTLSESKEAENIKSLSHKLVDTAKDAFKDLTETIKENVNKTE